MYQNKHSIRGDTVRFLHIFSRFVTFLQVFDQQIVTNAVHFQP